MEKHEYVVVGTGVAGTSAAAAVREHDEQASITLLGEEEMPLYSRIMLPRYIGGEIQREGLQIRRPEWYLEQKINLVTGVRAESLDAGEKHLSLSDGSVLGYERLLLATGARCFVPPVEGAELPGILTLRTMKDADRIRKWCDGVNTALVVGGGLLGLELAGCLTRLGLEATVVELAAWLLPLQLDEEGGRFLQAILEQKGLRFVLDKQVKSFSGAKSVTRATLQDGRELDAPLVLISAGVRPRVELARGAGAAVGRGITVDDHMVTSLPEVFAAGDCAEHRGRLYGVWPAADEQGKVAGAAMAGGKASFSNRPPSHNLRVNDLDVFSAGRLDSGLEARVEKDARAGRFEKLFLNEQGSTVGAILIGDMARRQEIMAVLSETNGSENSSS